LPHKNKAFATLREVLTIGLRAVITR